MKILFLAKRRPQGRDLLSRPYGRFFHLPAALARRGHESRLLLLGYRREAAAARDHAGVAMTAVGLLPWGPRRYLAAAAAICRQWRPDWVVGLSDTWYGIAAAALAARHGARCAIDAYDNYESYLPRLAPLHALWRRALRRADLVTAAGPDLARLMGEARPNRPVHVVPMAADPGFAPRDRGDCRRRLGLPAAAGIIGYCGSIHPSRGIDTVFQAYELLRRRDPELLLVLTGRRDGSVAVPAAARWLGYLADEKLPCVLNALDVLLVPNRLTPFGRFSHPAKLYEAMSCRLPVVAAATPATTWILGSREEFLARPEDAGDFAAKTGELLRSPRRDYPGAGSWEDAAALLETLLLREGGRHA